LPVYGSVVHGSDRLVRRRLGAHNTVQLQPMAVLGFTVWGQRFWVGWGTELEQLQASCYELYYNATTVIKLQ